MLAELETVRSEMRAYDGKLDSRPYFVVANKLDELDDPEPVVAKLAAHFEELGISFCAVSALTDEGIPKLVKEIIRFTDANPRPHSDVRLYALEEPTEAKIPMRSMGKIQIISLHGGGYRVLHRQLEKAVERYDMSQEENVARFTLLLRKYKVEDLLEAAGAVAGDGRAKGHR